MPKKRKLANTDYTIESSPFYNSKSINLRSNISQINTADKENIVLARKRFYKQDDYVKVIIDKQFDVIEYYKLSNMAKTMLMYIIRECLEFNNPTFRFVIKDFVEILNLASDKPVYKGRKELINVNYIAPTNTKEVYWINFNKFYKGVYVVDKFIKTR